MLPKVCETCQVPTSGGQQSKPLLILRGGLCPELGYFLFIPENPRLKASHGITWVSNHHDLKCEYNTSSYAIIFKSEVQNQKMNFYKIYIKYRHNIII